ncbi:hypothetical protein LIA77_05560 [Sarocladium implicatum]|nr:hypothetical protein LIA77_05560 [Sarocladium implicatum]
MSFIPNSHAGQDPCSVEESSLIHFEHGPNSLGKHWHEPVFLSLDWREVQSIRSRSWLSALTNALARGRLFQSQRSRGRWL